MTDLRAAKERAWRQIADIDAALERGEIDEAGWHDRIRSLIEASYLSAQTPQGQSGHSGDAQRWEYARRGVLAAIDRPGDFLDIGCANGLLMESVARWSAEDGVPLEPYGVDISAALVDLARRRCPQWADRFWVGNAREVDPGRRFDFVRTGLDYVPARTIGAYVARLLRDLVAPGGRLIVGMFNEETDLDTTADRLRELGYRIAGSASRPHRAPGLSYKVAWLDRPEVVTS